MTKDHVLEFLRFVLLLKTYLVVANFCFSNENIPFLNRSFFLNILYLIRNSNAQFSVIIMFILRIKLHKKWVRKI